MAGYDHDKVVKMLKANEELKQSEVAQKLGVTIGQVPMLSFNKAQVEAGIYSAAPATQASVAKLRKEGNRWELIAARTGLSVASVKAHAEASGLADSYTGRGRNFNGVSKKSGSKTKSASKSASKKTSAASKKSSSKKTAAAGGRPSRSGGRPSGRPSASSKRRSSAANPS